MISFNGPSMPQTNPVKPATADKVAFKGAPKQVPTDKECCACLKPAPVKDEVCFGGPLTGSR